MKNQIKNWFKRIIFTSLIGGGITILPKICQAGGINGHIFDSHNNQTSNSAQVEVIINNGSSGTETCGVPYFGIPGYWTVASGNFDPEPQDGDTAKMSGSLTVGPKTYTANARRIYDDANITFPTTFLDDPDKNVIAHAFGVWNVSDTSNVSDTLRAEGWLNKNPGQKIQFWNYYNENAAVDTSCPVSTKVYLNTEKQDSTWKQNDNVTIRLYKTKGDTVWESDTTFHLDTLKYGGATMLDNIVFPERKIVTDVTPPTIANATQWSDTTFTGPYNVKWTRSDAAGIAADSIVYNVNRSGEKRAAADSVKGDTAYATIDTVVAQGDSVFYRVKSNDNSSNKNEACWPDSGFYGFKAKTIGINEDMPLAGDYVIDRNPCLNGAAIYNKGTGKFDVTLYNIMGQKVEEIKGAEKSAKVAYKQPAGAYIAKVYGKGGKKDLKLIKLKK